jgi:E3 ubiquitin-protein ligase DRIP
MDDNRINEIYNEVINIDKEALVSHLKCPLCFGIFRTPFTINECMHTFCKVCIFKYFSSNTLNDSCPVCGINLGGKPTDTLIFDNSISVLVEILFPEFDELDKQSCVKF